MLAWKTTWWKNVTVIVIANVQYGYLAQRSTLVLDCFVASSHCLVRNYLHLDQGICPCLTPKPFRPHLPSDYPSPPSPLPSPASDTHNALPPHPAKP